MADDENVIPFPGPVTWARLYPPADLAKVETADLLKEIEACGFECEAGPLERHVSWQELKRRLIDPMK